MSTCPGRTLEDWLMWALDLIVDGDEHGNPGMSLYRAIYPERPLGRFRRITGDEFKRIVALCEPHRESFENFLDGYEEDSMSWRDYGGMGYDYLPNWDEVEKLANEIREKAKDPR